LTDVAAHIQAVGRLGISYHRTDTNADASRFLCHTAPESFFVRVGERAHESFGRVPIDRLTTIVFRMLGILRAAIVWLLVTLAGFSTSRSVVADAGELAETA
jgi:hypothetical protein